MRSPPLTDRLGARLGGRAACSLGLLACCLGLLLCPAGLGHHAVNIGWNRFEETSPLGAVSVGLLSAGSAAIVGVRSAVEIRAAFFTPHLLRCHGNHVTGSRNGSARRLLKYVMAQDD